MVDTRRVPPEPVGCVLNQGVQSNETRSRWRRYWHVWSRCARIRDIDASNRRRSRFDGRRLAAILASFIRHDDRWLNCTSFDVAVAARPCFFAFQMLPLLRQRNDEHDASETGGADYGPLDPTRGTGRRQLPSNLTQPSRNETAVVLLSKQLSSTAIS